MRARTGDRHGRGAARLLLTLAAAALAGCARAPAPPHVFLITADALRADHLSAYGYPRETSPRLDELAEGASLFRRALSPIPKTGPAFASLLSGRHPREHGVGTNYVRIPDELPLLPELLQAAGYHTVAFVSNPVLREAVGFSRGFDHFFRLSDLLATETVTREFLRWSERYEWDRPTFVWIHYLDPHGPYTPPDDLLRPFLEDELSRSDARVPLHSVAGAEGDKVLGAVPRYQQVDDEDRVAAYVARYDAEIRFVDGAIGSVLDSLRERDLFDPALIVFTSDHGESLGEHDYYFEHGWFAYEPGLHVPLLVKEPGRKPGRRVDEPVSLLDLHATLLAATGLPAGGGTGVDLRGPIGSRDPILVENADRYPHKLLGLRAPGWKYLARSDGVEELYDLEADPGELESLVEAAPPELEHLRGLLRARLESLQRSSTTGLPTEDDERTRELLRALGY